jgi:hypothetical protein
MVHSKRGQMVASAGWVMQEYKTRTIAELAREFFDVHREDGWFMDKCAHCLSPRHRNASIAAARAMALRARVHRQHKRKRDRRYHPDIQEKKEKQRSDLAAVRARHFRQRVFEGVLPNLERAEADAGAAADVPPKSAADAAMDVEPAASASEARPPHARAPCVRAPARAE